MIFPKIQCDNLVQVQDKFRISALTSYISKDEPPITKVEIEPFAGSGFVDVTGADPSEWFLDFEYPSAGTKVVSCRVTTTGAPTTTTKSVECVDAATDNLFSKDEDITAIESSILNWIPEGRNTFKYIHREAQNEILEYLYTNGYVKIDNQRFTKADVIDITEMTYWSKYMALRLIFEDLSNLPDDVYAQKAKLYENDEHKWRMKAILKIDTDNSGDIGTSEGLDMISRTFCRE